MKVLWLLLGVGAVTMLALWLGRWRWQPVDMSALARLVATASSAAAQTGAA